MARKKTQQTPASVRPSPESLQASATRVKRAPSKRQGALSVLFSASASRAFCLVVLAAIYAPLSQLTLSPVYGSAPSAVYHRYGIIASSILAFAVRGALPLWVEKSLPSLAFWTPSIQFVLFSYSTILGNPVGPLVTELLTCFPLITLSLYTASRVFEDVDLSFVNSATMQEAAPSMTFYMLFVILERTFKDTLPHLTSIGKYTSRLILQLVIGIFYGLLLPQSLFWPAVPPIAFTMIGNVHNPLERTTIVLNNTLALHGYTLLERRESITGYISILENTEKQFRVMRCDHSLLGGEWIDTPVQRVNRKVAEPIYAVFTMMEAVRLVQGAEQAKRQGAASRQALNIGLGVGTAPSALIAHGVNTTIVELDPVVHYFAEKYFSLPKNHSYFIGDAVEFVEYNAERINEEEKYDYILHDVFTGGAVPTSLFTREFLMNMSKMLKKDGTIVINYAGDLNLLSANMIYRTIDSVFPNCRIFREEAESVPKAEQDFTNLVYFCTHPENPNPIKFRKPVTADYLGSGARREHLVPKHELNVAEKFGAHADIVTKGSSALKELDKWQIKGAVGHWHLMRTVVPDVVWENW